jgi:uncharacterized protein (TIGR03083 family)
VTHVDKERVVPALAETWRSIDALCRDLDDLEWDTPTDCPGWTVKDQVSHMIGTESMLAGRPMPSVDPTRFTHIRNAIGETNEAWIDERRSRRPAAILEEFRSITSIRLDTLSTSEQAAFDEPSPTPAGDDTYGRFMQIRVMDCWVHEQDIREATGRPGHREGLAVEVSLDEIVLALGYVVGKQAAAPDGSSVRFDLTGASGRVVDVLVRGRARVAEQPVNRPTTTVRVPVEVFVRLAGGRNTPASRLADGSVNVFGDRELGFRVVQHLAYMI